MKKLGIVLGLLLTVSATMVGCGKKDTVVTMGTNAEFAPFEFMSGKEVVGFDVDISNVIAKDLGKELKIENMAFESVIASVKSGKVDFAAAGLTANDERKESVDFSIPYYKSTQVIITLKTNEELLTPEDLAGKSIGVQGGTTGEDLAKGVEGTTVEAYKEGYTAVMDLINGRIDAVVIDEEMAKHLVEANEETQILDHALSNEEYAIAVQKGNTELLDAINATIKKMQEDGTYDELYKNYFND